MDMAKNKNTMFPASGIAFLFLLLIIYLIYSVYTIDQNLRKTQSDLELIKQNDAEKIAEINEKLDRSVALYTVANADLESTRSTLSKTEGELQSTKLKLNQTEKQLIAAQGNLEQKRQEFSQLQQNLTDMTNILSEQLNWLKGNSLMPEAHLFTNDIKKIQYEGFLRDVGNRCVKHQEGVIKLGCINFLMDRTLSFGYISEARDKLTSIEQSVQKEGGDCEDFTLFMKGMINTLKSDPRNTNLELEAMTSSSGNTYVIYGDPGDEQYWYYNNLGPVGLGTLGDITPYGICYITGYSSKGYEGHCIVAVSEKNVTSIGNVANLNYAQTLEPQSGVYMGQIGRDFHLCRNGEDCGFSSYQIFLVMADDDLYIFRNGEWISYGAYEKLAVALNESITFA